MKPAAITALLLFALLAFSAGLCAQPNDPFTNNRLPGPYNTLREWAELLPGMTWPAITGVQQGPDGNLYVLGRCHENSCAGRTEPAMLIYNTSGKLVNSWGAGLFNFPHGFLICANGNVWISDAQIGGGKGNQVFKFSKDGKLLLTLGKAGASGTGSDVFDQPTAIAIGHDGDIFVAEGHSPGYGNSRIVKFSKDGKLLQVIGKKGRGPGEFMGPHGLAIDSQGRLFVADRGNNRLQILDQNGKFIAEWRQFGRPSGVFIDKNDIVYVADSTSSDKVNPGYKQGIRIGSVKDGKVTAFIPWSEGNTLEGVAADDSGNVYGGFTNTLNFRRFVKK